jgi:hypothetical protein
LSVLHYRWKSDPPAIVIEFPERTVQVIPISWTDQATPSLHQIADPPGSRLSGLALLDLARLIESWQEGC